MRIICAPDSFKESLTAAQAAQAMGRGIVGVASGAQVDLCPIADGGEGTVDAMLSATGGEAQTTRVTGPLGEPVNAVWGLLGRTGDEPLTAIIEMAAASGLALVAPDQRDATRTTTFGTGQLIEAALAAGAQRIIMGIGGSATNDGGCGMATALGAVFRDGDGQPVPTPGPTGGTLCGIDTIDLDGIDKRIRQTQIIVACDVTNPLTGLNGAAHIYGPQKGATPKQVEQLDHSLAHLAQLIRDQLGKDIEQIPGAGAAGGLGGGLLAYLGARLQPGIELVLEAVGFDRRVQGCDLCLTGEGRLDGQSVSGKACLGVAAAARRAGVDTVALVGSVGPLAERTIDAGLKAYHVIGPDLPVDESMRRAAQLLQSATANLLQSS